MPAVPLPFPPPPPEVAAVSIRDLPVFAVDQRFHLTSANYDLLTPDGQPAGSPRQTNANVLFHLAAFLGELDRILPYEITVTDATDQPVLVLRKPAFEWSTVTVTEPSGGVLGYVTKKMRLGKARFELLGSDRRVLGAVRAENWRAKDFTILDATDREVGKVTKQWRGLLREGFTQADAYVVDRSGIADPTLRDVAAAAVFAVDLLMKQKR